MIIVDFSQIAYAAVHATTRSGKVDGSFLRHLVLSSILHIQRKHSHKYGPDIVLACDHQHCWRQDYFPLYKWSRHQDKDKDPLDWDAIHSELNEIQSEIRENFKYLVINVEGAEGDDVIGVMTNHAWTNQTPTDTQFGGLVLDGSEKSVYPTLIVSSDKDYGQFGHIADQYDPRKKTFITSKNPDYDLLYLILKGDVIDGIPNILSPDDVFTIKGQRQKSMGQKLIMEMSARPLEDLRNDPLLAKNWIRNNTLVNLRDQTPPEIASKIMLQYYDQRAKKSHGLMDYFFKHHLNKLMEDIQEFQ